MEVSSTALHVGGSFSRPVPDPRQPKTDPFAFLFRRDLVYGMDGYSHGLGECLEVAERSVLHTEGMHQHDCPRGPVPLGFVDGRDRTVEQLVTDVPHVGHPKTQRRAQGRQTTFLSGAAIVSSGHPKTERFINLPLHRNNGPKRT